jgi:DNA polymerase V
MSRRVMETLEEFTDHMEIYSIDEAFLRFPPTTPEESNKLGAEIRQRVGQWTGIPVAVGFAPTKTLAKLANHLAKKRFNGVCSLTTTGEQQKLFSELLIEEIWGIGRKISARLHTMGIHTIGDFLTMEPAFIRKEFNTPLLRTQRELQGMDCLPLEKITEPQKVILTSRSFGHNIRDLASLQEAVALFTSRCARRLRSQNSLCERVEVFLATNRFRDEPQYSPIKGTTLTIPTASTATLLAVTKKLLEEIYHNNYKYKKAGVIFSGLLAGDTHQMSLFSDDWYTEKEKTLMTVIDKINKKLGDETIRYAATGIKRPWGMLREKLSPKYTTDWNQLPVAK